MSEEKKYWFGSEIKKCNLCERKFGEDNLAGIVFVDGRTVFGPWAIMCLSCHDSYGVGLGIGRGQAYALQRDGEDEGKWLKIA